MLSNTGSFTFEITCSHPQTEVHNHVDATTKDEGYTGDTYCKMCGALIESGTKIPKFTIQLNAKKIPLKKGQKTNKVKAIVSDDDSIVSITSSNKKVVKVTKKGVIKGIKKGTAKVTYISKKGAKATLIVEVQNETVKTKSIKITNVLNKNYH